MIISEETELKVYLTKRKYPLKLIEDAIEKVHCLDRSTLLSNHKTSEESDIIPYVTTFNPNNPEIYPPLSNFNPFYREIMNCMKPLKTKLFSKVNGNLQT